MGLFDKLTGSRNVQLTPKSALVLSALTVVASDGVLDEAELNDLAKIVRGDKASVNTALQVLKSNQLPEAMTLVADCLNDKQKLATITILLDLAMADGILAGNEEKIIRQYMEKFGLSEDTLKPIFETIGIKNDLSVFS